MQKFKSKNFRYLLKKRINNSLPLKFFWNINFCVAHYKKSTFHLKLTKKSVKQRFQRRKDEQLQMLKRIKYTSAL